MQTSVHWLENVAFEAKSESGHSVVMDGSAEYGGENRGPRPMELILMGLGGCASFDIVTILKKSRQDVTDVVCQLKAERADTCGIYKNSLTFRCNGKICQSQAS